MTQVLPWQPIGPGSGVSGGEITQGSWESQEYHHLKTGSEGEQFCIFRMWYDTYVPWDLPNYILSQ